MWCGENRAVAVATAALNALSVAAALAASGPSPSQLDPDACGELRGLPFAHYSAAKAIARELWVAERRAGPGAGRGLFPWDNPLAKGGAGAGAGAGGPPIPSLDAELRAAYEEARGLSVLASLEPWRSMGPVNIAGRTSALAIHPTDPAHVYIGGCDGGVWETRNSGGTWTPRTDDLESLASGALAIDPRNPQVIYYATGESSLFLSAYGGRGLFRSTDGGLTWSRLGLEFVPRFSRVLVDPSSSQTLWAAAYDNAVMRGVLKSTNGGTTWSSSLSKPDITGLVMDPVRPDTLYAAVGSIWSTGDNGIYRTRNGGSTWTRLTSGLPSSNSIGRTSLAIAPSSTQIIYAGISADMSPGQGVMLNIYKTTNGGSSWSSLGAPTAMALDWRNNAIAVHPTNPQIVLAGGLEIWRSTNSGSSWTNVGAGTVHVDIHEIAFAPSSPATVYVGCDGGVWRSSDSGAHWAACNSGLVTVQYWGIALDPTRENYCYGASQDNWMHKTTGTTTWEYLTPPVCGDVDWIRVSPINPHTIFATTCNLDGLGRSTDEGLTWSDVRNGIGDEGASFVPPLDLDPANPNVLFTGTSRIYKSTNQGNLWVAKTADLGETLTALAVSPASSQIVWAGASWIKLRSTNGGETWTDKTTGATGQIATDFAPSADPAAPLGALLSVGGYGTGHVFRTSNGGDIWANSSGNLPDAPVNSITVMPWDENAWLAGSDVGVFTTTDAGAHWESLAGGLPNVVVNDVWVHPATGLVRVGTMGRGAWEVYPGVPGAQASPAALDFGSVPVGQSATRGVQLTNDGTGPLRVTGLVIEGTNPGDFAVEPNGAGFILLPGDSAARTVRFTPAASGPRSARLHLVNEVQGGAEAIVPLAGTGGGGGTGVTDAAGAAPARLALGPPAPNPSAGRMTFAIEVPRPGRARLVVYNAAGQRVRTIADQVEAAGARNLVWDGRNDAGLELPSGTYFVRLESGADAETRKALLVR